MLRSAPTEGRCGAFTLGMFAAFLGVSCGAVTGAVYTLAVTLIGRRPVPPDGPEVDYLDLTDPPG